MAVYLNVALVTINRPEALNAFTTGLLRELVAVFEAIAIDEPGLVIPYDASRPLAVANALEAWQPLPALLRRESGNAA